MIPFLLGLIWYAVISSPSSGLTTVTVVQSAIGSTARLRVYDVVKSERRYRFSLAFVRPSLPEFSFALRVHNRSRPRYGSVSHLHVHNNWGLVVQAGIEYRLNRRWDLFLDYKRLWLDVKAEGFLANGAPVRALVTLDPHLISSGVKFHF